MTPEEKARAEIDRMLAECGWIVQDKGSVNLSAGRGVAVREVSMRAGHGETDYLLFVDGKAIGTFEAKPEGFTLTGVEPQSSKYGRGTPPGVPVWNQPLAFHYESTGTETHFTDTRDPHARARETFSFYRPETLADLAQQEDTLRARLRNMPTPIEQGLWPAQVTAIKNLDESFAMNRPRALIQMATGSGKTYMAISSVYRLVKFAKARRVLFLVDRGNLGRQAYKEFQQYVTPDDGRKFTELYNVQFLRSNKLDPVCKVCITTIQRLYSMLKGEEDFPEDVDEQSAFDTPDLLNREPLPVVYNPRIPIETFDFIFTDECHRSIYNLWRQVLDYFDGFIVGLTATPSKQTLGYFNQNLVMEYTHDQAVADGVNVNYDVYRIRTKITEKGSTVRAGFYVDKRDRQTRKVRWEQLDEDLSYDSAQLDVDVVAPDQIRKVVQTFRDRVLTEIFPGRTDVPKTLVYAKDDSHADDIVKIVREEFGKGNDFCQKITYRTTGVKTDDLIAQFRNSYDPRVVVTVDMIATGTDIKPLEIVFFLRSVKSRTYFEQMKGRGVRVISDTEFQAVTPDAKSKDHFVIVDAVGVCERDKTDSRPLERKRTVSLEKLLDAIAMGNRQVDVVSSLAGRLARLEQRVSDTQRAELKGAGGISLDDLTQNLLSSLNPDSALALAQETTGKEECTKTEVQQAQGHLIDEAVKPLATQPELRRKIVEIHRALEQTVDTVSQDELVAAGFDQAALDAARATVQSFEQFIAEHKDEITALQVLYSRPHSRRLTLGDIKALAAAIEKPPRRWTPDVLWQAYERLGRSAGWPAISERGRAEQAHVSSSPRPEVEGHPVDDVKHVRKIGVGRLLTDLVTLVRLALHQQSDLIPFSTTVNQRFEAWMTQQLVQGRQFIPEQRQWLELIRDHITASLGVEAPDFDLAPFSQRGGLGKAYQLFGSDLARVLEELNEALVA